METKTNKLENISYIHDDNEVTASALMLFENHYISPKIFISILDSVSTPQDQIAEYFGGMILEPEEWEDVNAYLYN